MRRTFDPYRFRSRRRFGAWLTLAGLLTTTTIAVRGQASAPPRSPRIFPDYTEITIPPNIAPLNFSIEEPGHRYRVIFRANQGKPIEVRSNQPGIVIPMRPWQEMLQANRGQSFRMEIAVQGEHGWQDYATVTNRIAREPIDGWLAYRLLKPLFNFYTNLGLYQRNLESYEEREVLHNRSLNRDCLNCHTFLNHRGDTLAFQVRSATYKSPMMLVLSNEVIRLGKTAGYLSWHPSGRLIAYSENKPSLFFHTVGECREEYDVRSNLGFYRVDSNAVAVVSELARADQQYTWPSWSPDGRYLYFCSAPVIPVERYREIRYSLCRIPYDLDSNKWSSIETLVSAKDSGLSAAHPRVSPDGQYLVYCLFERGNFPIYQASSDLYIMDLKSRQSRRMEINSNQSESWHGWSSNGRWLVFSSKRWDGLFARPNFSYFDEQGHEHKPFVLPQRDPAFYQSCINTYNLPELIRNPVIVKSATLASAVQDPLRQRVPTSIAPAEAIGTATKESSSDGSGTYYQPAPLK